MHSMISPVPKTRVLVYGNSLLLEGVCTLLQATKNIELVKQAPDVVIYDATNPNTPAMFESYGQMPGVRLIGLDPQHQRAIITQGKMHRLTVPDELTRLILES